jgi:hypothetical protein
MDDVVKKRIVVVGSGGEKMRDTAVERGGSISRELGQKS